MGTAGDVTGSEEGNHVRRAESLRDQSTVCSCTRAAQLRRPKLVSEALLFLPRVSSFIYLFFGFSIGSVSGDSHSHMGGSDVVTSLTTGLSMYFLGHNM